MSCSSLPCATRRGRLGRGLFAGKPDNAQKQQPKPPPPNLPLGCAKGEGPGSLPCATRRGGLGRGAVRGQARQRAEATAKATPSQPPPWLRQRGGGLFAGKPGNVQKQQPKLPPPNLPLGCAKGEGAGSLPCATRRGGLGRGAVRGQARQRAEATAKATPSQPPPWLRQRGGAAAPSLAQRAGEGWGGVLFAGKPGNAQKQQPKLPPPNLPLGCAKGEGPGSLPCATRRGWVCKGGFQRSAAGKRRQQLNLLPVAARWRRRRSPACRPSAPPGCGW